MLTFEKLVHSIPVDFCLSLRAGIMEFKSFPPSPTWISGGQNVMTGSFEMMVSTVRSLSEIFLQSLDSYIRHHAMILYKLDSTLRG